MNDRIALSCVFRFHALSEKAAHALESHEYDFRFGRHFQTKSTTAHVKLDEEILPFLVTFIQRHSIAIADTDIFLSLTSPYDTYIIDIPDHVNQACCVLGSKLVLSYTITSEE